MKTVTASQARKEWFRLLDEAAQGEVILVRRKGRRLVLRREDVEETRATPKYRRLLQVPGADEADRWSWKWRGLDRGLVPRRAPTR